MRYESQVLRRVGDGQRVAPMLRRPLFVAAVGLASLAVVGCFDESPGPFAPGMGGNNLTCSVPSELIFNGGPGKDGIPALTDPLFVGIGEPGTEYLKDDDRVVGLDLDGQVLAIPLNIFWWHEIINLRIGEIDLAITHCPLTGSSLAFDRAAVDGAEFGVSGLLFMNNLLMYDRATGESLWPQMLRGGRCGPEDGTQLSMVSILEVTWGGWRSLHPNTRVVSSRTGFERNYTVYPYGDYDRPENSELLFPMPSFDQSRPPKERVLGIPVGTGGLGFPYGRLEQQGPVAAVHASVDGVEVVVFWDSNRDAAMAYQAAVHGRPLTFSVQEQAIRDAETGTLWRVDGYGIQGELAGQRLQPLEDAFISYWFAWSAFYPDAEVWSSP